MPPPLDEEVLKRLLFLDRYPTMCQDSLDASEKIANLRVEAALEESSGSTWQWPAAVGVLTGLTVGYWFGHH